MWVALARVALGLSKSGLYISSRNQQRINVGRSRKIWLVHHRGWVGPFLFFIFGSMWRATSAAAILFNHSITQQLLLLRNYSDAQVPSRWKKTQMARSNQSTAEYSSTTLTAASEIGTPFITHTAFRWRCFTRSGRRWSDSLTDSLTDPYLIFMKNNKIKSVFK